MEKQILTERHILLSYLREHFLFLTWYALIILIFFLLSAIYGYEDSMANMCYAVVLIAFFALCFAGVHYFRYRDKCRRLHQALLRQGESDHCLPEPINLPEQLYQDIVVAAEEDKRRLITQLDDRKRELADYYTMWTHQIKTPLAAMRLLLQEGGQPDCRKLTEELFKTEQYAEMALHYARLESISADMVLLPCDIFSTVKQAVKKYAVLFIGSGLSFSLKDFSCQAVTDEKWLCFVIEQVLSNALKYTPAGAIRINGGAHQVSIEDTGIGISESDLPRIFERGFTGYNGRLDKKSTGIGLYLCRQIMDRLGHTITVTSVSGKGTCVTLGFSSEEPFLS